MRNFFDKLQPYFGEDSLKLHYTDTDSIVLDFETVNLITDLKNLPAKFAKFQLSSLKKHRELYKTTNEKLIGKFEKRTPITIDIEEINALKAKTYCLKLNVES